MPKSMGCLYVVLVTLTILATPARARAQVLETVSADATLSDSTVAAAGGRSSKPVEYFVDLGVSFVSITDLTFSFVFSTDNPLDPDECLEITGGYPAASGFCAVGLHSETERTLTFPCSTSPAECAAYLDGSDAGLIIASSLNVNPVGRQRGRTSVIIESFTIIVRGVLGQS